MGYYVPCILLNSSLQKGSAEEEFLKGKVALIANVEVEEGKNIIGVEAVDAAPANEPTLRQQPYFIFVDLCRSIRWLFDCFRVIVSRR